MPEWNIHNKWAEKLEISKETSDFVNGLIDFPQRCSEFIDFLKAYESSEPIHTKKVLPEDVLERFRVRHDKGRKAKTTMYLQFDFLKTKGSEFVEAWFLHHALDYIKTAPILSIEEVLERLEKRTKSCPELEAVKDLVRSNATEILQDLESNG